METNDEKEVQHFIQKVKKKLFQTERVIVCGPHVALVSKHFLCYLYKRFGSKHATRARLI